MYEKPGGQLLLSREGHGREGLWEHGTQTMVATSLLLLSERYPLLHVPWQVALSEGMSTTEDV